MNQDNQAQIDKKKVMAGKKKMVRKKRSLNLAHHYTLTLLIGAPKLPNPSMDMKAPAQPQTSQAPVAVAARGGITAAILLLLRNNISPKLS